VLLFLQWLDRILDVCLLKLGAFPTDKLAWKEEISVCQQLAVSPSPAIDIGRKSLPAASTAQASISPAFRPCTSEKPTAVMEKSPSVTIDDVDEQIIKALLNKNFVENRPDDSHENDEKEWELRI
jgi:hypothetical protein